MELKHQRWEAITTITHSARLYRVFRTVEKRQYVLGQIQLALNLKLIKAREARAIINWMALPDDTTDIIPFAHEEKENNNGSTES